MSELNAKNIFTIGVGGAAGDGVREAGAALGTFFKNAGFYVFVSYEYPSLIKGGHNLCRISFSGERVRNDHHALDALVALNGETIRLHAGETKPNAVVMAERFDTEDAAKFGASAVVMQFATLAKELGVPALFRSSAALGGIAYLAGFDEQKMVDAVNAVFKDKSPEANVKLAQKGYAAMRDLKISPWQMPQPDENVKKMQYIDGNAAFAEGMAAAGLEFFIAYPMTPATSILHHLAVHQKEKNIKVIQAENEIAVINMAIGSIYAGKRTAICTSGGGFALMQEAFSYAGISETPLVVALSQRQGPATGAPTHTSQGELMFSVFAGHGEFPRIVLAPGDPEESFAAGADAMNLAWRYQTPVIVLLDKHLSESQASANLDASKISIEKGKVVSQPGADYKRYAYSSDGISPLAFPGTPDAAVKVNSYEHDEDGITTEDSRIVGRMQEKRAQKHAEIEKEFALHETVKVYGDSSSETTVVFWGSTKAAVLEAAKQVERPVKYLQVLWMEPFDSKTVAFHLKNAKTVIAVEANHDAQLCSLIRMHTGINIARRILRYDSNTLDPRDIAEALKVELECPSELLVTKTAAV
jgi:2-oxoglutarate/2-oxoacid ferredoxin oxidoreductase subunit alpha